MNRMKFSIASMMIVVTVVAILLAATIETRNYVGTVPTISPDKKLTLNQDVFAYSTFFKQRRTTHIRLLDADAPNGVWDIPNGDQEVMDVTEKIITPEVAAVPVAEWSSDSRTVRYCSSGSDALDRTLKKMENGMLQVVQ